MDDFGGFGWQDQARVELEAEANAAYDSVNEAYFDTRVPDDWDEPTVSELLFQRGRGTDEGGYNLYSSDYCAAHRGWHVRGCPNQEIAGGDEPPF